MSVRLAMTFSEVSITDIEPFLASDRYAVEQKVDGTRALVVVSTEEHGKPRFEFLGRNGKPLTHAAAALHFKRIERALAPAFHAVGETVLDGEVMFDSAKFVIFDLPYCRIEDRLYAAPDHAYADRRAVLVAIRAALVALGLTDPSIVVARSATDADDKRALLRAVEASNGEGVMVKDRTAVYHPGKRVKHSVKVKFVKTADVVVTASTRGRNAAGRETGAFTIAVHAPDGTLVEVGATSAIGKAHVEPGDVIEVAYLYLGAGGRLVQPRMMKRRDDKTAADCTMAQFPIYSKAVLS